MNREQRRALKKKGISQRDYAVARLNAAGVFDESKWIKDGEQVKLNVDQIMERPGYSGLQDDYKAFVEASREMVFTARLYRKREDGFSAAVELVEVPKWLFWYGDLIHVKDGG